MRTLQAVTKPTHREIEDHYPDIFTDEVKAAKAAVDAANAHYRDVLRRATEAIEASRVA